MDCTTRCFASLYGLTFAVFALLICISPRPLQAQAVIEWTPLNSGLQGGTVEVLWQSPSGAFFAGGSHSGLFRSPAFGEPWQAIELGRHQALDFTADPDGNLYLQTKEAIFRSTNDGLTWSRVDMDFPIWPILFMQNGSMLGQFEDALYIRQDNATKWKLHKQWTSDELHGDGSTDIERIHILKMTPNGTLIAGVDSQFLISNDGHQWDCVTLNDSDTCYEGQWGSIPGTWVAPVASAILLDNYVLMHTQGILSRDGFIYDPDQRQILSGSRDLPCGALNSRVITTTNAYYASARSCCTMGVCGGMGFYRLDKSDSTFTWEYQFWDSQARTHLVAQDERWVCNGSGKGIMCSLDGGESWESWNEGLENITTASFFFQDDGDVIAGTQYGMTLNPEDPDATWQPLRVNYRAVSRAEPICSNPLNEIVQHTNNRLYALVGSDVYQADAVSDVWEMTEASKTCFGFRGPGLYDENPAASRLPTCTPWTLSYSDVYECTPLHRNQIISIDSSLYYTHIGRVYRSDDGFTDHLVRLDLPDAGLQRIHMVMASPEDGTLVVGRGASLLFAYARDEPWVRRDLPDPELAILDITAPNDSLLLIGTNRGIYRTFDQGLTWEQPLASTACFNRLVSNEKGVVLAGDRYLSRDYGATWEHIASPLPGSVSTLAFDENGRIYAGTLGRGNYRSSQPIYTAADAPNRVRETLTIDIFPNPAQDFTHIKIDITQSDEYQIALFDMLGRRVGDLYRRSLVQGTHQLDISLPDVPPGVYIMKMQGGGNVASWTITLL